MHGGRENKWFGSWLMDDCITYPIACEEGIPVTTALPANLVSTAKTGILHAPGYEDWLGMTPVRLRNAFFRELVIFEISVKIDISTFAFVRWVKGCCRT